MKSINLILLLFLTLTQITAFASEFALKKDELKAMLSVEPDYMDSGKYEGLEIDQSRQRPVQRLKNLESENYFYVTQFYHHKKFWVARIPKGAIRDMILQLAQFNVMPGKVLAHGQMRFIFEKDAPVVLYRLKQGEIVTDETRDFIFSIEAARPKNVKYSGLQAMMGNYQIVARLVSTYDRAWIEETLGGDIVTQYRLINFSAEKRNEMLLNSVNWSSEVLMNKKYEGKTANCMNLLLDLIDQTLNLELSRLETPAWKLFLGNSNPVEDMALKALDARGLLGPNSKLQDYFRAGAKPLQDQP